MASSPHPPRNSSLSTVPDRVLSPRQDAQARRAARREQMQSYYGLTPSTTTPSLSPNPPSSPLPDSSSTGRPRKPRTTDFSSPHFVPAAYYEDLISRASLPELLKTTSTLATDVGRLHSSRHTLVYNHHHQLFSAGDTIAALNDRTPQLLSIVTELQERFSQMSQLADSVALPEPKGVDENQRVKSTVELGVERVRLMVVAGDEVERVKSVWEGVEKVAKGASGSASGLDKLLEEGRELVSVRVAME